MNRAQWIADGTYGIMTHWLVYPDKALPDGTREERTAWYNKQAEAFDVDTLMKQFDESGAEWLCFTFAQSNGYFASGNSFLDKNSPGHTPKRDLGMELAKAVKKRGKRFIIYLAGNAGMMDKFAPTLDNVFCWKEGEDNSENTDFIKRQLEFMEAYAVKYGRLCDGWWIDGLYPTVHKNKWEWEPWCRAMRKGNPDCAVSLSDGSFCVGELKPVYDGMDFFGGETHLIENGMIRIDNTVATPDDYGPGKWFYLNEQGYVRNSKGRPEYFMPAVQYIGGVQLHSLLSFDMPFSPMPVEWVSFSADELIKFVKNMQRAKGGVTINVPNDGCGRIPESTMIKLRALKKAMNK